MSLASQNLIGTYTKYCSLQYWLITSKREKFFGNKVSTQHPGLVELDTCFKTLIEISWLWLSSIMIKLRMKILIQMIIDYVMMKKWKELVHSIAVSQSLTWGRWGRCPGWWCPAQGACWWPRCRRPGWPPPWWWGTAARRAGTPGPPPPGHAQSTSPGCVCIQIVWLIPHSWWW